MKAGLLCLAGLSAAAIAQPHRQRHHHQVKRQGVEVVTNVEVVTATAANAVVYVDASGNVLSTSYAVQPVSYATEAPAPESSSVYVAPPAPTSTSSSYVAPAPVESTEAPAPSSYVAPETSSAAAPASSSPSDSGSSGSGYAIVYSPYNSDNTCKDQTQVNNDFEKLSDYSMVRIYGTDCNQTATVLSAASAKGMKIFAGVYTPSQVNSEVQLIIDAAAGNWDSFDTVSVGNEGVNNGQYGVSDVVSAIGTARSMLTAAGYSGSVVTVDTFVAVLANPELCEASDYAAVNCHAFFDGGVSAEDAGEFVLGQAQRVSEACGGKNTMITETGWPWQGQTNGAAVPSPENQSAALKSLKKHFSTNIVLFTAFNDYWKKDTEYTFGAERYWGMLGDAAS